MVDNSTQHARQMRLMSSNGVICLQILRRVAASFAGSGTSTTQFVGNRSTAGAAYVACADPGFGHM